MPKVSKRSEVKDLGVAESWENVADGYELSIVHVKQQADISQLLKGLPNDRCPCPHWGYVLKGTLTFKHADHEETFEAGDVYYVEPDHTPHADAGTEFVIISPAELVAEVNAVIEKNAAAMQSA